jgi:hypothetical protein
MILNKRQIFTLVTREGIRWDAIRAARSKVRQQEVERRKVEELQKWESEGGDSSAPSKLPT